MTRPHWRPDDRYVTVISGTWYIDVSSSFAACPWVTIGEPLCPADAGYA